MGLLAFAGLWKGVGDAPRWLPLSSPVSFASHRLSLFPFLRALSTSSPHLHCPPWFASGDGLNVFSLFLLFLPLLPFLFSGFPPCNNIPPFTFHVLDLTKAFGALLLSSLPHLFLVSFSIICLLFFLPLFFFLRLIGFVLYKAVRLIFFIPLRLRRTWGVDTGRFPCI